MRVKTLRHLLFGLAVSISTSIPDSVLSYGLKLWRRIWMRLQKSKEQISNLSRIWLSQVIKERLNLLLNANKYISCNMFEISICMAQKKVPCLLKKLAKNILHVKIECNEVVKSSFLVFDKNTIGGAV